MGSKSRASLGLFLVLNFLFFTFTAACGDRCGHHNPNPNPNPTPTPTTPSSSGKCPVDALKLGVCANVLNILKLKVGKPPVDNPCCPLIKGLVDLEAALCLCTTIKANVLNIINLNIPVDLSLLVNFCGKKVPSGFQCP